MNIEICEKCLGFDVRNIEIKKINKLRFIFYNKQGSTSNCDMIENDKNIDVEGLYNVSEIKKPGKYLVNQKMKDKKMVYKTVTKKDFLKLLKIVDVVMIVNIK